MILGKLESPWKAIEYLESLEDEEPTSGQQRERERFGESGSATTKDFSFHSLSDLFSLQSLPLRRPDGNTLRRSITSSIGLPALRIECVRGRVDC